MFQRYLLRSCCNNRPDGIPLSLLSELWFLWLYALLWFWYINVWITSTSYSSTRITESPKSPKSHQSQFRQLASHQITVQMILHHINHSSDKFQSSKWTFPVSKHQLWLQYVSARYLLAFGCNKPTGREFLISLLVWTVIAVIGMIAMILIYKVLQLHYSITRITRITSNHLNHLNHSSDKFHHINHSADNFHHINHSSDKFQSSKWTFPYQISYGNPAVCFIGICWRSVETTNRTGIPLSLLFWTVISVDWYDYYDSDIYGHFNFILPSQQSYKSHKSHQSQFRQISVFELSTESKFKASPNHIVE